MHNNFDNTLSGRTGCSMRLCGVVIEILNAIKAGDARKAQKAMTAHIERSLDNILKGFRFR